MGQGNPGTDLMVGAWDIYGDELNEIIFPESWSNALL